MRSLPQIVARSGAAVVLLALSILSACSDGSVVSTLGFGVNARPTNGAFTRSSSRNGTFTP